MATRRKPARKPAARRAATGTAKIRVHTDEYGRKVYTVVGTKKYAYTLAKAKELAAKKAPKKRASSKKSTALTTTRKRTTVAKRKPTTRRRTTGAKRNAKGQFVKAGRKTAGRRTTRRNAPRRSAAEMKADALQRTVGRNVASRGMFEVYGAFWDTPGGVKRGRQIWEGEGREDAIAAAEDYIDAQGVRGKVYREDIPFRMTAKGPRGGGVIYRGKVGSGVKGMLEVATIDAEDIASNIAAGPTGLAALAAYRKATRRNTSQSARLSQALDDRMFEVSVGVDRRVGMGKPLTAAQRRHTLASGQTVVSKRTRGFDKYETLVEFYREVRGRAAAIAVAEDAMRGAVPDYHRHVYREDKDHGKDAGAVAWRPKRDAGGEYRIHAYIDPIYE